MAPTDLHWLAFGPKRAPMAARTGPVPAKSSRPHKITPNLKFARFFFLLRHTFDSQNPQKLCQVSPKTSKKYLPQQAEFNKEGGRRYTNLTLVHHCDWRNCPAENLKRGGGLARSALDSSYPTLVSWGGQAVPQLSYTQPPQGRPVGANSAAAPLRCRNGVVGFPPEW